MVIKMSRGIGGLLGLALAAALACGGSPDGSTPNAGKTAQPEPKTDEPKPVQVKPEPEPEVKPEPQPEPQPERPMPPT